ncbi:MAG: winged helix-turn-helix domain-containing protein [Deltaproteobacteria bacterium]|nr:winged helix-turn-helix domain-containing protein [Deltaproteobacteria bacterium]
MMVQEATGLGHTPRLSRAELSTSLGLSRDVLKRQLQRMIDAGFIARIEAKDGRHEGGTVYRVQRETMRAFETLNREQQLFQPGTHATSTGDAALFNRGRQPGTAPALVSSSERSSTTTNQDRAFAEKLQLVCERYGLGDFSIGPNDLMTLWRRGAFAEEQDMLDSIEHIAFYLASEQAKGIQHPKAWMLKTLGQGFYAAPNGFKSWEQRQLDLRLAARQQRLAQLREARRQEFETEFEIWLSETSDAKKRELLAGTPFADSFSGKTARAMLRERFAAENGIEQNELPGAETR